MQNSFPEIPLFRLGKAAVGGFDHRIHDLFGGILRDMQLFCRIFPHRKAVQQMFQNCDFLLLQRAFCAFVYVERGNRGVVYALRHTKYQLAAFSIGGNVVQHDHAAVLLGFSK